MSTALLILFLFFCFSAFGQNKQLLYDFTDLPQSLMSNPGAETNFDLHFGLPLLSQVHVSAGSSGMSMYDIFKKDGNSINSRIPKILSEITNRDIVSVNQQLELLFFGWRDRKKRYFSTGIYQELDAFAYFPKDLAVLAYEGNKDHIGKSFQFSDATFTAEVVNVFHFGLTDRYSKNLTYGIRGKLYSSIFNAHSVHNRGTFRTVPSPSEANVYRHFLRNINILVNTSGYAPLVDSNTNKEIVQHLVESAFLGGNFGLGLDLGFTYYLKDRFKITGSIIDLGFISHHKDVENYKYYGNYQTDGIELLFPGGNYWDAWEADLEKHLKDETLHNSYITWRPTKINASINFGLTRSDAPCYWPKTSRSERYISHLGFQFFAIGRPKGFLSAATLSYDRHFLGIFNGKITYTANSYTFSNIGVLLSAQINNFNFYLAADNLLSYANLAKAHNASVQFGFQFIIDRP